MLEEELAPEETEYLDLLATLVEAYEREQVKISKGSLLDVLHELMDARDMKQADFAKLVGSSGTASEIYHGKCEISKALAKKLGEHFSVEYTLFL
jgi:HTH-type transcriptional regulator / antitoxin HigA